MAKFNKPKKAESEEELKSREDATENEEGGLAFKIDAKSELYTRASTAMIREPKFYDKDGKGDKEMLKLIKTVSTEDPEFVLKLASYCRNELYLRSSPIALLVESCKYPETKKFVRAYSTDIIQRADELTEALSCWNAANPHKKKPNRGAMICNPLRKGLVDSLRKFNEYNLAKYDRDGAVKLRDVVIATHPKPKTDEERELWKKVLERTLKTPETWEVEISGKGSTKENWENILPKMGFMARIRNLRNFLEKGVDVTSVIEMLEDKKAVANSKQFPYRFFSAYREIEEEARSRKVLEALETAIDLSIDNVPEFKGLTFITTDNSGSMSSPVSQKSKIKMKEIGNLLGAMANKLCDDAIVSVFGESFKVVNIIPSDGIISNCEKLNHTNVGHSTNAWKSIQYLLEKKIKVDRILIFSDMQCYDSEHKTRTMWGYDESGERSLAELMAKYRKEVNPNVYLYSFDLQGYGTTQFPKDSPRTCLIAGWSDKVLQFIPMFEEGKNALEHIESITPGKYAKKIKKEED